MRIRPRCPGLPHSGGTLLQTLANNGYVKVFLSILLIVIAVVCVFAIIFIETRSSWSNSRSTASSMWSGEDGSGTAAGATGRKLPTNLGTDMSNTELRYGVVIDCGSSGSRVYVYFWPPHTGTPRELLAIQPVRNQDGSQALKKITPGLSTYDERPSEASDYLRPLLQYAANHVPENKHAETPLYIMATAGLRMLPESSQRAIMDDLRVDIPMEYHFMFVHSHAEVISGKQEGVYAWIAVNYALGRFDHSVGGDDVGVHRVPLDDKMASSHHRKQTIGMIDMGGGSVQIAYEVAQSEEVSKGLLAEFNLGCTSSDVDHIYRVYVSTFLGFGGNAARRRLELELLSNARKTALAKMWNSSVSIPGHSETSAITDPCLPQGLRDTTVHGGAIYHLIGSGDYTLCREMARRLLNVTSCTRTPCSMNGVFQPNIDFHRSEFYGFSEFYYTMEDLLKMGGRYNYLRFEQAAKDFCSKKWVDLKEWYDTKKYPRADNNRYRTQCFKSAWMATVLHEGFHFPKAYPAFTSVELIDGKDVHWTLGALLFKTRFFPLSAIQQHVSRHHHHPPWILGQLQHSSYIIIICFLVVLTAIAIYLRRLRIVRKPDLRKVPSMAYFMTEEDQVEEGIQVRVYT